MKRHKDRYRFDYTSSKGILARVFYRGQYPKTRGACFSLRTLRLCVRYFTQRRRGRKVNPLSPLLLIFIVRAVLPGVYTFLFFNKDMVRDHVPGVMNAHEEQQES